jgi:hypothetical protein
MLLEKTSQPLVLRRARELVEMHFKGRLIRLGNGGQQSAAHERVKMRRRT